MGKKAKRFTEKAQYPVATIIYYGPDDKTATKVVVGIIRGAGQEPISLRRWFGMGVEKAPSIQRKMADFIAAHGVRSVVVSEGVCGCPHEEGLDYPEGMDCPYCPFWKGKSREPGEASLSGKLDKKKTTMTPRYAVATYAREQWQRLRELAADKAELEDTWEEWHESKEKQTDLLRQQGFEVYEIPVDVNILDDYCRRRGIVNNASARAEYAANQLRIRPEGH